MTSSLEPGGRFARDFEVQGLLGEGGMGAVYRVLQTSTGKMRALKVMHPRIFADAGLRKRFEQEAKVGARIESDHVVEVHAAGIDEATGRPYLVMELLDGEDLAAVMARRGPLPLPEVLSLFSELCHAMGAAHRAGIVHRDLKPENVFLARSRRAGPAGSIVKVLDFGIAKLALEASTRESTAAVGSPLWMAPEQTSRGEVTAAADVWALGLMAFALLGGKPFWHAAESGSMPQLLREIVLDPIPLASKRAKELGISFPARLDAWFAKAVERDPDRRYPDASVLEAELRAAAEGPGDLPLGFAPTVPSFPPLPSPARPPAADAHGPPDTGRSPTDIGRSAPATSAPPPAAEVVAPIPLATPLGLGGTVPPPGPSSPGRARSSAKAIAVATAIGIAASVGIGARLGLPSHRRPPSAPPLPGTAPSSLASQEAPSSVPVPSPDAPLVPLTPLGSPGPSSVAGAATAPRRTNAARGNLNKAPFGPATDPGESDDARSAPAAPPPPGQKATTMTIGGSPVRLVPRLASNTSNVRDDVVRKAIEWDAWQYLTCYQRHFGAITPSARPSGTVTVEFDILDQLPQHGHVVRSDIAPPAFSACVANTLVSQTINAAGPSGAGHVVYAFQFLP